MVALLRASTIALGVGLVTVPASGWTAKSPFRAVVHGHTFDRIELQATGCALSVGLYFDAPATAYEGKNEVRDTYRFRALVKLAEGRRLETRVFQNRAPGRRKYLSTHDTTGEGCWAEKELPVMRVDVNGCRNRGCVVGGFE